MVFETNCVEEFLRFFPEVCNGKNPFQSVEFYKNYFKQHISGKWLFLVVQRNEDIVGIAPFEVVSENHFIQELQFIATRKMNYLGYICSDLDTEYVHGEVINYLKAKKKAIRLNYYDINTYSPMYRVLVNASEVVSSVELYKCPVVVLKDDFDTFFKGQIRESKKRSEIKKFYNKLSLVGEVCLVTVETQEQYEANKGLIESIYYIHKERFDGVYTPSHFSDISMRNYYNGIIKDTICGGTGYLSILLVGETPVSFMLCLKNEDTITDWIPAFDPAFEKYNLGTVHYYILFNKLCSEGIYKYFDYAKGDSVYKRRWAEAETANYSFDISLGENLASKTYSGVQSAKSKVKVFLRKKGILKKIKRLLGKYIKEDVGTVPKQKHIVIKDVPECETNINYSLIRYGSIDERATVLNAVYVGKSVNISENDENILVEVQQ